MFQLSKCIVIIFNILLFISVADPDLYLIEALWSLSILGRSRLQNFCPPEPPTAPAPRSKFLNNCQELKPEPESELTRPVAFRL